MTCLGGLQLSQVRKHHLSHFPIFFGSLNHLSFTATFCLRVMIFPLVVKTKQLAMTNMKFSPEMTKYRDEIMTSVTPEERKFITLSEKDPKEIGGLLYCK